MKVDKVIDIKYSDEDFLDINIQRVQFFEKGKYCIVEFNEFFTGLDIILSDKNGIQLSRDKFIDDILDNVFSPDMLFDMFGGYLKDEYNNDEVLLREKGKTDIFELLEEYMESATYEEMNDIANIYDCRFKSLSGYDVNYLAPKDFSEDYIYDLWEVENWYDLYLYDYKTNKLEQDLLLVYAPTDKDMEDAIKEYFGLSKGEYFIVDNEITKDMDFPKDR